MSLRSYLNWLFRPQIEKHLAYWCDNETCLFVVAVRPDARYCPACGSTRILSVEGMRKSMAAREQQRLETIRQLRKATVKNDLNTLTQIVKEREKL